jgi:hypothetical protein
MKDTNYITIQGWMVNKLGLSGNDLLTYAIIYGFSQDEESSFKGASSYLAKCLNVSRRTIFDILSRLVEKRLILKEEYTRNGLKYCDYRTPKDAQRNALSRRGDAESAQGMQNLHTPYEESAQGGYAESSPHISTNKTKDTAAADLPPAENPDQADPPQAATAEAIRDIKQEFKRLDGALIFDEAFYPGIIAFLAANRLDTGYLAWLYKFCKERNPRSITGFYYTVALEPRYAELYREYLRSRPPPPDRPVSCPVCGTGHKANQACPRCGLEAAVRDDQVRVERHKRLYSMPSDKRAAYESEMEALIEKRPSTGDLHNYFRQLKDLNGKYGLADSS